ECREVKPERAIAIFEKHGVKIPALLSKPGDDLPAWDGATRTLSFRGRSHVFARTARNQFKLLDAFQREGWSPSIMSPFKNNDILKYKIKNFNKNNELIKFSVSKPEVSWWPLRSDTDHPKSPP